MSDYRGLSLRRFAFGACVLSIGLYAGCGDSKDPFGSGDGGAGADADPNQPDADPTRPDADPTRPDAGPFACAPTPARMIVLGDSIAACSGPAGGKNAATCGPKILHANLDATYASGVSYENLSVPGAVTADVANTQLATIPSRPGHAVVLIFVGGNDLQPYIFASDANATSRFAKEMPKMIADWETIFDYLNDTANFPDGVTVMMNTQYNPYDDCTASPYNLSAVKIQLLLDFNQNLTDLATDRANVIITDQHDPFLGHGLHNSVTTCPYYMEGAENWMADLIHPNVPGHANLAVQWGSTADIMYRDCQ